MMLSVSYLITLLLTTGVEMLVVGVLGLLGRSRGTNRLGMVCLCLNLTTHPLATLVRINLGAPVLLIEVLVVGVEAIGYQVVSGQGGSRSIALSLVSNFTSFGVGALLLGSQPLGESLSCLNPTA